jgi:hypothetical protein
MYGSYGTKSIMNFSLSIDTLFEPFLTLFFLQGQNYLKQVLLIFSKSSFQCLNQSNVAGKFAEVSDPTVGVDFFARLVQVRILHV